jgi:hypothetical protein
VGGWGGGGNELRSPIGALQESPLTTGDSGSGTLQRILFRELFIERLLIGNNLFFYYVLVKDRDNFRVAGETSCIGALSIVLYLAAFNNDFTNSERRVYFKEETEESCSKEGIINRRG